MSEPRAYCKLLVRLIALGMVPVTGAFLRLLVWIPNGQLNKIIIDIKFSKLGYCVNIIIGNIYS